MKIESNEPKLENALQILGVKEMEFKQETEFEKVYVKLLLQNGDGIIITGKAVLWIIVKAADFSGIFTDSFSYGTLLKLWNKREVFKTLSEKQEIIFKQLCNYWGLME